MCFSFHTFSYYYVKQFSSVGFLLSRTLKTENENPWILNCNQREWQQPTKVLSPVLIQASSPLGNEMSKGQIMAYFTRVAFPRAFHCHSPISHYLSLSKNNIEHNFLVIIGDDIITGIMKYQNIQSCISIMQLRS